MSKDILRDREAQCKFGSSEQVSLGVQSRQVCVKEWWAMWLEGSFGAWFWRALKSRV